MKHSGKTAGGAISLHVHSADWKGHFGQHITDKQVVLHRAERTHAAHVLERAALQDDDFAGAFVGGLRTLLLGSVLQGVALFLFLPFDGLVPLYLISALFGLFQGGIVPSYAIIVREHFPPKEAGARVGTVLMCTLLGMALGGWMSGKVFDLTGSYHAAFINGIAWNLLNGGIAAFLWWRSRAGGRILDAGQGGAAGAA